MRALHALCGRQTGQAALSAPRPAPGCPAGTLSALCLESSENSQGEACAAWREFCEAENGGSFPGLCGGAPAPAPAAAGKLVAPSPSPGEARQQKPATCVTPPQLRLRLPCTWGRAQAAAAASGWLAAGTPNLATNAHLLAPPGMQTMRPACLGPRRQLRWWPPLRAPWGRPATQTQRRTAAATSSRATPTALLTLPSCAGPTPSWLGAPCGTSAAPGQLRDRTARRSACWARCACPTPPWPAASAGPRCAAQLAARSSSASQVSTWHGVRGVPVSLTCIKGQLQACGLGRAAAATPACC